MALQDRVFSLETEYAITFYTDHNQRPGGGQIVDVLMQAVAETHGTRPSHFLVNGSRLAHDVGHAEWALPECRSGRELAVYDKAADHLFIDTVVPRATELLNAQGFPGKVVVAKNNVDPFGNTYGCHENYQMLRHADLLTETDFVRYIAQSMVPFLATRQIFAGSGRLAIGAQDDHQTPRNQISITYELSQRARFIETTVSRDTTRSRPIFNLGREDESFSTSNFRRLHQIMGDAVLSGWANWIKMASTGLLLRMIEDVFVDDLPALDDPVEAMHTVCQDLTGTTPVALQDGRTITALDIQWTYYNQADTYLNLFGATEEDEALMEEWGKALEDFEQDPMSLRDRADWAIKKQLLDSFLAERDASFENETIERALATDLQAVDLRFHELSPEGLYTKLYPADTVISLAEINRAKVQPPPYTRARVRGEVVRLARECQVENESAGWVGATLQGVDLRLADPMVFDHPGIVEWDRPWHIFEQSLANSPSSDELYHKLGRCYQREGYHQHALDAFRAAVDLAPERLVYLYDLAHTLSLLGLYEEAIMWWEKYNGIRGFGRDMFPVNYNALGDAYRFAGQDAPARQAYDKAARQTGPAVIRANENMALLHLKQGETRSAQTYLDKVWQTAPRRLITSVSWGVLCYAQGNAKQAADCWQNALALPPDAYSDELTPEAARYFQAVAQIGLAEDDALDSLHAALNVPTALAAAGLYALKPLLTLLAQAPDPPPDVAAALALSADTQIIIDPSDPAEQLPVMAHHIQEWLHDALDHPIQRIRRQAVEYIGWRLIDDRVSGLADFVQHLVRLARHDPAAEVRRLAIQTLTNPLLSETGVMDVLIQCLHDEDAGVRWAAQAGLETLSAPVTMPPGTTIQFGAEQRLPTRNRPIPARGLQAFASDSDFNGDDDIPF